MKIKQREEADLKVLIPEGRIDAVGMNQFSFSLNEMIDRGTKKILIDFSHTEYMSSSGIRALLQSSKKMEETGGKIALCSPNEQLQELFSVVQFDKIFTIYKTDFEAYEALLD